MPVPIHEQQDGRHRSSDTRHHRIEPNDDSHSRVTQRNAHTEESEFTQWRETVSHLQSRVTALTGVRGDRESMLQSLYVDAELARMSFCTSPTVATYLHSVTHATDPREVADLEKTLTGTETRALLAQWDALRDQFARDLMTRSHTASKLEMYTKMIVVTVYTLLSIIAALYLMPLRLLHPLLRVVGLRNHFLPIDLVQKLYCRGFLYLCGVRVSWEGLEHLDYARSMIGMFSHASNMDPIIVASGPYGFKWIAKRSLFRVPLLGWVLGGWGHIAIDRNNREAAVQSLNKAVETIHRFQRSIAVSPEGTRSKSGLLQDFKKGPFHTAMQVDLPIQPILIQGAYQLWPPKQTFPVGGEVTVKLLQRIERRQGESHMDVSDRVRTVMLEGIRAKPKQSTTFGDSVVYVAWLPITMALMALTAKLLLGIISGH